MALISKSVIDTKMKMIQHLNGNLHSPQAYHISNLVTNEIHKEKMLLLSHYHAAGEGSFIPFSEPFTRFVPTDMLDRLSAYYAPVMESEGIYYLNYQPCDDEKTIDEVRDGTGDIIRSLFHGTHIFAQEISKFVRAYLIRSKVYVVSDDLTVGISDGYDLDELIDNLNRIEDAYYFYRQNKDIKCYSFRDHLSEDKDAVLERLPYTLNAFIEAPYAAQRK